MTSHPTPRLAIAGGCLLIAGVSCFFALRTSVHAPASSQNAPSSALAAASAEAPASPAQTTPHSKDGSGHGIAAAAVSTASAPPGTVAYAPDTGPITPLTNEQYRELDPHKDAVRRMEIRKLNIRPQELAAAFRRSGQPQSITVDLFGRPETITFQHQEEIAPNNGGLAGILPFSPTSIVTMGYSDDAVAITIHDPATNRFTSVLEVGDGSQRVIEYALNQMTTGCSTCGTAHE